MSPAELPRPLKGIIPPMVTPLQDRDSLDVEGLERLIEHILGGGVHGLFLLGTTGEAPSLSHRLQQELVERSCRLVAGRVPVLVGITDTSIVEALTLARFAAETGAQALVLSAPYFYATAPTELRGYVRRIATELPLPVVLYNVPGRPDPTFDLETLRQAQQLPNILGLKDSSANMLYFHQVRRLLAERPEWTLLVGPEELLAEAVLLGGRGGVSGGANVNPRLYVDLFEAAERGEIERVNQLHRRVIEISCRLYHSGVYSGPSSFLNALKTSLSFLGICSDFVAEPFDRFGSTERSEIWQHLVELGLTQGREEPAPSPAGR
jgi:dihydrodipicolinate synthase/N-acetylneuraminate lyase